MLNSNILENPIFPTIANATRALFLFKPFKEPRIDSQPGGIDASDSSPGLFKCFQIRAQAYRLAKMGVC
jgi:hypothetical protein